VACALARVARHVTGIDLTPAMIELARLLQAERNLYNITWEIGDANPLPYKDSSFSLVATRYSFHHFIDSRSTLDEMKSVCIPGGRVAVIGVTPPEGKANAYNHMEKLRDPSHVRALSFTELHYMTKEAELIDVKTASYKIDTELEKILPASQTKPDDAEKVRQLFEDDLNMGSLGGEKLSKGRQDTVFISNHNNGWQKERGRLAHQPALPHAQNPNSSMRLPQVGHFSPYSTSHARLPYSLK
jgi:SAM-dependent methyltransferase